MQPIKEDYLGVKLEETIDNAIAKISGLKLIESINKQFDLIFIINANKSLWAK